MAELAKLLTPEQLTGATQLLVLQGTPFCNIDCQYCYLPHRNDSSRMAVETISAAVNWIYSSGLACKKPTICWHAGEPLVLPPSWYYSAIKAVQLAAPNDAVITHAFQTNGMLINEEWCELLTLPHVRVGISIDGPQSLHDARRLTRNGQGTHQAAMQGISRLRRHGIPFNVIAVVTRSTLEKTGEFLDFFDDLGAAEICLNVEEIEGVHKASSLQGADTERLFRRFMDSVIERSIKSRAFRIREISGVWNALVDPGFGTRLSNDQNGPFRIVTITTDGSIYTFSPELAGQRDHRLGSFAIGNVHRESLDQVLATEHFQKLWQEIRAGVENCRKGCPYFRLCLGGAPANKLAEHGRMDVDETMMCRLSVKATAESVLSRIECDLINISELPQ
ncbi:cyclophane-forming radical SAM/SPASM peptide maturase GrrM/OscB [Rhizobium ruizarguesonis]